jgi:hypothetical protein
MVTAPGHLWRAVHGDHHRWATYGLRASKNPDHLAPTCAAVYRRVTATVGGERLASNLGINYFAQCRSNLLNNVYAGTASEIPAKVLELRAVP